MITQDTIRDHIFLFLGNVQLSKRTRESLAKDPIRRDILELRERLIEIASELKTLYWIREANIQDNLLPLTNDGEVESLIKEGKEVFKKMTMTNSDIVWTKKEEYGIQSEYSAA